ncbi:MAG: hypothetical protein ABEJ74_00230 [Haloferacaceae archaeon]
MEIRGERECQSCGQRWSYYDSGSVACPNCGALRSVGVAERERHTDAPATLDVSGLLASLDQQSVADVADDVKSACRTYARKRGFINGGDLRPLDDQFLLAYELRQALDVYERLRETGDAEERYVLALLAAASVGAGERDHANRPPVDAVPTSMREARGLGYAAALDEYRRELLTWLEDHPDPEARRVLGTLGEERKRVAALQGDVPPAVVERLVTAACDVGSYLADGDEAALARAEEELRRVADESLA